MVETSVQTEIKTLLARNLFVRPALKQQILSASPEKQQAALVLLKKMDQRQTAFFQAQLKKNPHLFADVERLATQDFLRDLSEQAEAEQQLDSSAAEAELNKILTQL